MAKADQWMDLARKLSRDPRVQSQIAKAFFSISTSDPALGRRLLAGDPQAVMEAYQTLVRNGGSVPIPSGPPRIGSSPIGPGEAVGGVSGPGVPVSQGTAMVPSPPRALPHDPSATRALTTTGDAAPDALDSAARDLPVIDARPRVGFDDNPSRIPEPLEPEDPFMPAVSERPRLGHSPIGSGVPVGGPAGGPRGLVPTGARAADAPSWVPYAAGAAAAGGIGAAAYYGSRRGEDNPANVDDDLEAAATPITPDAEVPLNNTRPQVPRRTWKDLTEGEYRKEYSRLFNDMVDKGVEARGKGIDPDQYAYNRDTGLSPAEAAHGRGATDVGFGGATFTLPDGSEGVMVNGRAVPAHLDATGRPLGGGRYYTLGAENRVIEAEREAMRNAGGDHGVPGPRTDDGRNPTAAPQFRTAGEAERYYTRPRDPQTGQLMPSQADLDMEKRGFGLVYGDDGEAHYQMGWSRARGAGPDVRRNLAQYTNHKIDDGHGHMVPAWTMAPSDGGREHGPTGDFATMVPTQATRDYNAQMREDASVGRIADRTGRSRDEVAKMSARERRNLQRDTRLANERQRAGLFSDMARQAGGSQGLRGGVGGNIGMFQALAMLGGVDPNRMNAQQRNLHYALPGGREAAAVDAQNLDRAYEIVQRQNTGRFAGQGNTPLENAQADAQTLANQNALASARAADENVLGEKYAPGDANWFPWWLGGGYDEFTIDEQQQMYDELIDRGYKPPEAQAAVDRQAGKRRATNRMTWGK